MNKPFDVSDLMEKLKSKGVAQAEAVSKLGAECLIDWVVESCALHENAIVKIGGPILLAAKPAVMKELDKIDNVIGN